MIKLKYLKNIRVIVSIFFFIILTILIINPQKNIPEVIINIFTSFQLIPSIFKIIYYLGITTLGLIIVLLLTIFWGRVYCSSICPLGTLQDLIIYIKRKVNNRLKFNYKQYNYIFHYIFGGILGISGLLGIMSLLNIFEPYSIYGRLVSNLFEPAVVLINNFLASLLEYFKVYSFYRVPIREFNYPIIFLSVFFLGLIVYLSYFHGRLFCNSFCPAGALLSLISRLSIYKIVIEELNCNGCGVCERVCKANCIDSENKSIDFAACISCFNCIKSCPKDGIVYSKKFIKIPVMKTHSNNSRRNFLKSTLLPLTGLVNEKLLLVDTIRTNTSGYFKTKLQPITPPGSISLEHFTDTCTACHLCVSACPTQVLYPTLLGYGIEGMLQPRMNYTSSYCNYECTICSKVCPTGAILPLDVERKKTVQIGRVEFFKDDCVVVAKKKECAACSEHCPTKAVYMMPYEGKLKLPEINNDLCIGCGHCENACPTVPRKAIYVKANIIHQQAKKPEIKKKEQIEIPEEFPF